MKNFRCLLILLALALSTSAQKLTTGPDATSQPTFVVNGMDGKRIDIADLRGKIVVLNLWFINCPNCLEEIASLNALVDQYRDNSNVVFLGLAASPKNDLVKFLQKHPFKYQIIPDAAITIIGKLGTPGKNGDVEVPFPMHYVLDREGYIVVKVQGTKGIAAVTNELTKQFAKRTGGTK